MTPVTVVHVGLYQKELLTIAYYIRNDSNLSSTHVRVSEATLESHECMSDVRCDSNQIVYVRNDLSYNGV